MTFYPLTCADPHGSHKIVYTQWGDPTNSEVVVCLPGLTRNRHDFDSLAPVLAADYRVICPDIVGRGESDWLAAPEDYGYALYVADMLTLLESIKVDKIDLVGTSLGGIIGMMLAARPDSPIRRLVINDVGPLIPKEALRRIAFYLTKSPPYFATLNEVEKYLRSNYAQFGPLTDAQWQHLAQHSAQLTEEGNYRLAYDPNIAKTLQQVVLLKDVDLWSIWNTISCPVLVLHGEQSDVLQTETIQQMQATHPNTQAVTFEGIGHAPALLNEQQITVVKEWLQSRIGN
jgi:pimeloyl-ACP methyl ester carboxylesterase